jgi:chromosome segregation ATPase
MEFTVEVAVGVAVGAIGGYVANNRMAGSQYKNQIANLENEIRMLKQDKDNLSKQRDALDKELSARSTEIKSVKDKLYEKEDAADDVAIEMNKIKVLNKQLQAENDNLKSELIEYKDRSTIQKQEIENLKDKNRWFNKVK